MRLRLVAIALAVSPIAARAASTGPEIGLRAGYAFPFGDVLGDGSGGTQSLSDTFTGGVPLQVELGYRFSPVVYAGLYGSYGFLFPNNCPPTDECSGHDVRVGLDFRFHLVPAGQIDPWFGIGAGYEWLSLSETSGGQTADLTLRGFEFGHVELGADFAVSPGFRIGPFASASIGQYSDGSTGGALGSFSSEISDKKIHGWLTFGLRAAFGL